MQLLQLLTATALALGSHARPLTQAERTSFYGYAPVLGPSRPLPTVLDANESLKSAAARAGIFIGAAVNYGGLTGATQGPLYPITALSQFSLFTAENEVRSE